MDGVERGHERIKDTGEVFTPTPLVQEILGQLDPNLFQDSAKTFLDPTCGDGQFLGEVLIRKLEAVSINNEVTDEQFGQAPDTVYGVDLMLDNVKLCQDRLLCGQEQFRDIVKKNIICANSLAYLKEKKNIGDLYN